MNAHKLTLAVDKKYDENHNSKNINVYKTPSSTNTHKKPYEQSYTMSQITQN